MIGTRSAEHSLRSQVGIGSESHCLLGQLNKILEISDSEAGLKVEKSGVISGSNVLKGLLGLGLGIAPTFTIAPRNYTCPEELSPGG